jgi:hypothetical protein
VDFTLLSDPDSEVIERFGILNTLIDPDDHPWYGIPYPGAYVIDGDGVVIAKFFETSLHFRASADQLLRAALGEQIELPPLEPKDGQVEFDVSFDGEVLHPGILRDLIVRFAVPDGQHLYGEPVPAGMVATSVEIDDDVGLIVRPPVLPPTTEHTLAGTGETLQVFEGDVIVRVPLTHLARSLIRNDDDTLVQRVSGTVRWQACDDDACHLPRTERFTIDIPAAPHNRPEAESTDEGGMDVRRHLIAMVGRRTDRSIAEIFTEMTAPDE